MPENLAHETKTVLKKLAIFPRKKMGQNFMVEGRELSFIADALCLKDKEKVLEIGPGLGFLTRALLEKGADVIAVEKDRRLAGYLRGCYAGKSLKIIESDVLDLDLNREFDAQSPIKVIGNIPYNITSPILEWLITQRKCVSEAVLTMQWEVAQRLSAHPGTKTWGSLSLFLQVYSEVNVLRKISRSHFFPVPKVDSAVVRLTFFKEPKYPIMDERIFFELVHRAFQKRRKTILNALAVEDSKQFSKEVLAATLKRAGIDPIRRPETLTIPEWVALSDLVIA